MNKLLSIQDRVGAWGQSFVPPTPSHREDCWSRADSELCVIPPCYFRLKGHQKLFLYWAEYFYVANVLKVLLINLFCTLVMWLFIPIKPAMGVSHSLFHPYGICVFTTQ